MIERSDHITARSNGRELGYVHRNKVEFFSLYHLARAIQESSNDGICVELCDGTVVAGLPQSFYLHVHFETSTTWFEMTVWRTDCDSDPEHFDSRHVVRLERVRADRRESAI